MFRGRDQRNLEQENVKIRRLHEIGKAINSELDLRRLLKLIMDSVIDLTRAERGFLILNRNGSDEIVVARNIDREEVRKASSKISHSIAERVRRSGEPVLTNDASSEKDLSAFQSVADLQLRSILCVPFRIKDRVLGVLYVDHRFQRGNFTKEDLSLLELFSDQAAIAIENARLYEENLASKEELERLNRELRNKVHSQAIEIGEIKKKLENRERELEFKYDYQRIVGSSDAIQRVFGVLDKIIETDIPVILLGESGTGKELVSKIIHFNSRRKDGPFLSENCGAIPLSLMESEFFGYVKGAFTGADRDKPGVLELAHQGTLFLDEIAEMDISMQKRLLRALQDGQFRKVGGKEAVKVDVRLLSATNQNLDHLVAEKRFRADLYYRLKGVVIQLPALRERREDIPLLVDHFLDVIAEQSEGPKKRIAPEVLPILQEYDWPGNVRELENEIRRMAALADDVIEFDLAQPLDNRRRRMADPSTTGKTLAEIERQAIMDALTACKGRKGKAAELLGIPRRTFYDKLKKFNILK